MLGTEGRKAYFTGMSKPTTTLHGPSPAAPRTKGPGRRYFASTFHKHAQNTAPLSVTMIAQPKIIIAPKRGQVKLGQYSHLGLTLED